MATARPIRSMDPYAEQFWAYTQQKQFRLQQCAECATVQYPPREVCHKCLSAALRWRTQQKERAMHAALLDAPATSPFFQEH